MARRLRYELIYDPEVWNHILRIDRNYHSLIRKEIEQQLPYQPELDTRNRKPLVRPSTFGATWELRFGPENRFRVFYRTDPELRKVYVLAVGVKIRERLYIGGKEFEL